MFKNDEEKIERMTLNPVFNSFVKLSIGSITPPTS